LAVIVLGYYAKVRWPLPTGLMAVLLGMVLAWSSGLITPSPGAWQDSIRTISWHPPTLQLQILWENRADLFPWLGVIVPMGLFNVIGSLQNLESAEAAGDRYATRTCLLIDGVGTLAAAALGSCFPTTIYIGHSGFKDMGARSGYSWLNGVVMSAACFFGLFELLALLIPIDAGMAIVLYIGIAMTAQAFQATPSRHAPAVVLGLLPGLAGWGAQLLKAGLRAGGLGTAERPFNQEMVQQLARGDVWAAGAFALEQGQIITAMLLAALLVFAIEGRFLAAASCSGCAAVFAWFGVIHAWQFSTADTVVHLGWGTGQPWAIAYAGITVLVLIARRLPKQQQGN
jgi:AGZA family xanthine/uracil permease-like MFS transporter